MSKDEMQWTNVVFIGPAQHGKSTLGGYLLLSLNEVERFVENKAEIAAVEKGDISRKYAFILDRTKDERGMGQRSSGIVKPMTLHPTWWGFEQHGRRFMLIDTPGQYIVNRMPYMIGGISEADAAVLVVDVKDYYEVLEREDAKEWKERGQVIPGLIAQLETLLAVTRFYGLHQLVIAVAKMDQVNFSKEIYETVVADIKDLLDRLGWESENVQFVPTAIKVRKNAGYNICESGQIDWYSGKSLLDALMQVHPAPAESNKFRMQVNKVFQSRAGGGGIRGYQLVVTGKILSASVQLHDEIQIFPSNMVCKVRSIRSIDGYRDVKREERWQPQSTGNMGQIVGLGLSIVRYGKRERIQSGEMISALQETPVMSQSLVAELIVLKKSLFTDLATKRIAGNFGMGYYSTGANITHISFDAGGQWMDATTLKEDPFFLANYIDLPQQSKLLAKIHLDTQSPLDVYIPNSKLGKFILIDPNQYLVCGGIIKDIL